MPHDDDFHGPMNQNADDMEWDCEMAFGYDDYEEEKVASQFSCDGCGPWCPDWGGDGLCMIAIRAQVDAGPIPFEEEEGKDIWRKLWAGILDWIRWNTGRCPDCGRLHIFGHSDCIPF